MNKGLVVIPESLRTPERRKQPSTVAKILGAYGLATTITVGVAGGAIEAVRVAGPSVTSTVSDILYGQRQYDIFSATATCPQGSDLVVDTRANGTIITNNAQGPDAIELACKNGANYTPILNLVETKDQVRTNDSVLAGVTVPNTASQFDIKVAYAYDGADLSANLTGYSAYHSDIYKMQSNNPEHENQISVSHFDDNLTIDSINISPRD